jgi:hypothetical protein
LDLVSFSPAIKGFIRKQKGQPAQTRIIHLEKLIDAEVSNCFSRFASTAALRRWVDPESRLTRLQTGGRLRANYFPGYTIMALIKKTADRSAVLDRDRRNWHLELRSCGNEDTPGTRSHRQRKPR